MGQKTVLTIVVEIIIRLIRINSLLVGEDGRDNPFGICKVGFPKNFNEIMEIRKVNVTKANI
jgi:hypothetical protein